MYLATTKKSTLFLMRKIALNLCSLEVPIAYPSFVSRFTFNLIILILTRALFQGWIFNVSQRIVLLQNLMYYPLWKINMPSGFQLSLIHWIHEKHLKCSFYEITFLRLFCQVPLRLVRGKLQCHVRKISAPGTNVLNLFHFSSEFRTFLNSFDFVQHNLSKFARIIIK